MSTGEIALAEGCNTSCVLISIVVIDLLTGCSTIIEVVVGGGSGAEPGCLVHSTSVGLNHVADLGRGEHLGPRGLVGALTSTALGPNDVVVTLALGAACRFTSLQEGP